MIVKATILLIACLSLPVQDADAPDAPMVTEASTVANETTTTTVTAPSATTKINQGFSPLPSAENGRVLISGVASLKQKRLSQHFIYSACSAHLKQMYHLTSTPMM